MKQIGVSGTAGLRNVFVHLTKACNLRCRYCYFSASKPLPDELTTSELKKLWPQVAGLRPLKIVLTGGEPLVRDDIVEVLENLRAATRRQPIFCAINTNGILV